jgi:cytochrome c-type biogenesis protein
MDFSIITYGLAYLAGILSTLSPCVLPLVPIVLASAVAAHRWGALALTTGLMLSFTAVGMLVSAAGASLGLTDTVFHNTAAVFLVAAGIVLLSPALQARLAVATGGAANAGQSFLARFSLEGLRGQFLIGLVLGAVWSPCVGPTLGAAAALAAQGKDLAKVAALMAIFGLGAGTPLLVLGMLSRTVMMKLRGKLMSVGSMGKSILGAIVLLMGLLALSGCDKALESQALKITPDWLVNITTRY